MLEFFIFGTFAGLLVFSSCMVVLSREAIHGVLWLILAFLSASALWILLYAEFLGLLLLLVYVGAVLTLFLFVIMTLSNQAKPVLPSWRYLVHYATAFITALTGLSCVLYGLYHQAMLTTAHTQSAQLATVFAKATNTQALGKQLYTDFIYPFELVGILLLVAVIVSISLHSDSSILESPKQQNTRLSQATNQVRREDRVQLVRGE